MALNFTEKQHWKSRVEAKLKQRIEDLREANGELIDRLADQAHDEVISSLGMNGDFEKLNHLDDALLALEEEKQTLLESMQAKICGEDLGHGKWSIRRIQSALADLKKEKSDSLLLKHDLGRTLEALKTEKEQLTDAILLATHINQIIDIWERVTLLTSADAIASSVELPLFADQGEAGEDHEEDS